MSYTQAVAFTVRRIGGARRRDRGAARARPGHVGVLGARAGIGFEAAAGASARDQVYAADEGRAEPDD